MLDNPVHILIDTDGGSDDLAAIGIAIQEAREGKVIIDAITCVDGNVDLRQVYNNVKTLLDHLSVNIPVYCGASEPLVRDCVRAYSTHGNDGLGDKNLAETYQSFNPDLYKTIQVIAETAKHAHNKIVCIGPLTNIALAFKFFPNEMETADIFSMATAGFGEGNVTPRVEFNIWQDPEAAAIVMKSRKDKKKLLTWPSCAYFIGWDTCKDYGAILNEQDIQQLANSGSAGKYFVDINSTLIELNKQRFAASLLDFADPIAMSIALEPKKCNAYFCSLPCDININPDSRYYGAVDIDKDVLFDNLLEDPAKSEDYICQYWANFARYYDNDGSQAKTFLIETLTKLNDGWRSL